MDRYGSLKKKNTFASALWLAIVLLILLELCCAVMLVSRIAGYSSVKERNYISLTDPSDRTKVSVSKPSGLSAAHVVPTVVRAAPVAAPVVSPLPASAYAPAVQLDASISAYDKNTVWHGETDVEIFRISYDNNGDLVYTVNSSNGDKLIAPGTQNTYEFTLHNTGDAALDYTLEVESYFVGKGVDGEPLWIPVLARMSDYTGAWMVGSASEWPEVMELNTVRRSGVIGAGKIWDYRLEWMWPFERTDGDGLGANDAFDTALGNLAVDEDLELHIIIRTTATQDTDPDHPGGTDVPDTGDTADIVMWGVLLAVSFVVILFLLLGRRKKDKDDAAEKQIEETRQ